MGPSGCHPQVGSAVQVLKFTNRFSWMRHKRVRTITFKQHEWDFDEDEDMAHAHAHGHPPPPQTQTLQVATGPLVCALLTA